MPLNILFILSDQHHHRYLGCADHPWIHTPHLDALAARGLRFTNAYCASPLCGPSRMALLSGLYPCHSGVYANGQALASDLPTYAHAFSAAGYQTALIGRMHIVGPDQAHGFERIDGGDVTASTLGGGRYPHLDGLHAGMNAIGFKCSGPGDSAYQHYDDHITQRAIQFLRQRDPARPFMATVGLALPHCPFVCWKEDYQYYQSRAKLPEHWDGDATTGHPYLQSLYQIQRRGFDVTREDFQRSLAAYAGCVTATDRRIGRLLAALDELGLRDDTLVIYSSDHGEAAGEHGLWHKTSMLEGSAAIPLIMSLPGRLPQGQSCAAAVNLIDVPVTAMTLAQVQSQPDIDARSFAGLWDSSQGVWDDFTFSELASAIRPGIHRMLRQGPWKYIYYLDQPEQLFNLELDPDETRDRAAAPDCAAVLAALRARTLEGWDPRALMQQHQQWNRRNRTLYQWFQARDPDDPHMYRGPEGCNRLDLVPDFVPDPTVHKGCY